MKSAGRILDNTGAYRLWQALFAEKKLTPLFRHNDLRSVRRVLDVGCGPGTNTSHFAHADYVGIDINEGYIEHARARQGRTFMCADLTTCDVSTCTVGEREPFDFILCNSFFHHVDTPAVRRILNSLASRMSEDGHIHILDLVLPEGPSLSRLLARMDRGDWPRPLEEWRHICSEAFEPVLFEPYSLGALGVTLWNMVYFKGKARRRP